MTLLLLLDPSNYGPAHLTSPAGRMAYDVTGRSPFSRGTPRVAKPKTGSARR